MKKRAFAFSLALLMTVSAFGCENSRQKTEHEVEDTTAAATEAKTTGKASEAKTSAKSDKSGIDLSLGMIGYVKKSKKSSANATASSLIKSIWSVLTDDSQVFANDGMIYTNTGVGDFNQERVSIYFDPIDDYDYILGLSKDGEPQWLLCSKATKKDDYVGVYGDVEDIDELRDMRWQEVLDKYGLKYGKYTDIELKKDNSYSSGSQSSYDYDYNYDDDGMLDLDDPDYFASCCYAFMFFVQDSYKQSDKPLVYGIHGKDEPFPDYDDDPSYDPYGDVEYIITYDKNGYMIKTYAWDTGRDKKFIGDSEMGRGSDTFIVDGWDAILEHFGLTQGEYTE